MKLSKLNLKVLEKFYCLDDMFIKKYVLSLIISI